MTDLSHVTQEGRENGNRQEGLRQPWMGHPALEVDWIDGEPSAKSGGC